MRHVEVTSKPYADMRTVEITEGDFEHGSLRLLSYARPSKLFTAHEAIIVSQDGMLRAHLLKKIRGEVVSVIQPKAESGPRD